MSEAGPRNPNTEDGANARMRLARRLAATAPIGLAGIGLILGGRSFLASVVLWTPVLVIPLSVGIERWLGKPPRMASGKSPAWYLGGHGLLLLGAAMPGSVAMLTRYGHMHYAMAAQPPWSPLPMLVELPEFLDIRGWLVAGVSFVLLNLYLGRSEGPMPMPTRYPIVLGAFTFLSGLWFCLLFGGLSPIDQFPGKYKTIVSAINVAWIVGLWAAWYQLRRRSSRAQLLFFAIALHVWLFWAALPFCYLE